MFKSSFNESEQAQVQHGFGDRLDVDVDVGVATLSSAALIRLVEEVRHEGSIGCQAYDRAHNRHNR